MSGGLVCAATGLRWTKRFESARSRTIGIPVAAEPPVSNVVGDEVGRRGALRLARNDVDEWRAGQSQCGLQSRVPEVARRRGHDRRRSGRRLGWIIPVIRAVSNAEGLVPFSTVILV